VHRHAVVGSALFAFLSFVAAADSRQHFAEVATSDAELHQSSGRIALLRTDAFARVGVKQLVAVRERLTAMRSSRGVPPAARKLLPGVEKKLSRLIEKTKSLDRKWSTVARRSTPRRVSPGTLATTADLQNMATGWSRLDETVKLAAAIDAEHLAAWRAFYDAFTPFGTQLGRGGSSMVADMGKMNTEFMTLQRATQQESRKYQTISNAAKARHDVAMSAVRNMK
jgi:hypothetical protein